MPQGLISFSDYKVRSINENKPSTHYELGRAGQEIMELEKVNSTVRNRTRRKILSLTLERLKEWVWNVTDIGKKATWL